MRYTQLLVVIGGAVVVWLSLRHLLRQAGERPIVRGAISEQWLFTHRRSDEQ
jgi:hypothetical protein